MKTPCEEGTTVQSWRNKLVEAVVLLVAVSLGTRLAYETARPLLMPALVVLLLLGLSSLVLRRRR